MLDVLKIERNDAS